MGNSSDAMSFTEYNSRRMFGAMERMAAAAVDARRRGYAIPGGEEMHAILEEEFKCNIEETLTDDDSESVRLIREFNDAHPEYSRDASVSGTAKIRMRTEDPGAETGLYEEVALAFYREFARAVNILAKFRVNYFPFEEIGAVRDIMREIGRVHLGDGSVEGLEAKVAGFMEAHPPLGSGADVGIEHFEKAVSEEMAKAA